VKVTLCDEPESDDGEVMIERIRKPDLRALHYCEAGCIDGREFMQIVPSKVAPSLF
jgi:hypothetical protein